ncbi:short chain dehydrogenase [Seiridium cupressi]
METHPTRVAVITGGGSGIGQAVVEALDARGEWQIHVFDVKFQDQTQTSSVHLHRVDICDYKELAAAFRSAFLAGGERLDFVFANAGILERENWYALTPSPDEPPPEPDWAAVEINLKGCMNTVRIARHYMAKSPDKGSILATSSSGGIWAAQCAPIYTASKHGIIGFVRSVAEWYYKSDGIRINILCPSVVRTPIVPDGGWDGFEPSCFTPIGVISDTVLKFIDSDRIVDAHGRFAETNYGITIVTSGEKLYLNETPDYCSEEHKNMVESGKVETQVGLF